MKDDLETNCMNELFGVDERKIAQIYTKTFNDKITSVVVGANGRIYFQKVIDSPELTAIQRGVSFVRQYMDFYKTNIFPDKVNRERITQDEYIKRCSIKPHFDGEVDKNLLTTCNNLLSSYLRWNFIGKERE